MNSAPPSGKKIVVPSLRPSIAMEGVTGNEEDGADLEAELLGSGKTLEQLRKESKTRELQRVEDFKNHFERLSILVLYAAAVGLFFIGSSLLIHMLVPKSWHWLSPEQIVDLKNIATGGVLAGVVASHLKKRI